MGAFENQIRENETFESLLELYSDSMEVVRQLKVDVERFKQRSNMVPHPDCPVCCDE